MSEENAQEPKKRPGRPRKAALPEVSAVPVAAPAKAVSKAAAATDSVTPAKPRRKAVVAVEVTPVVVAPVAPSAPEAAPVRKAGRPRKVVAESVAPVQAPAPIVAAPVAEAPKVAPAKPRIQYRKPTPLATAAPAIEAAAVVVPVPQAPVIVAPVVPVQAPEAAEVPSSAPSTAPGREPGQDRGPRGRGQRGRGGPNRGADRNVRRDGGRGGQGRNRGPGGDNSQARRAGQPGPGGQAAPVRQGDSDSQAGPLDEDSGFDIQLEESNDPSRSRRRKGRERGGREVDSNLNWCTRRWLEQLEKYTHGHDARQRWARGKVYSRRGQVVELEVGPNGVLAKVQGSRPKPYQVRIELNKLRREAWGRVLIAVSGKAHYTARLLAGEMPQEIEAIFASSGARLFPTGEHDFRCKCSCPDPMVPCKHVAAVYHAMGVALEADPFLLFSLRGKSKNQFLQDLRDMRFRAQKGGKQAEYSHEEVAQMSSFWRMGRLTEAAFAHSPYEGSDPTRLLHTLGDPPSTVVRAGMALPVFESTYRQVSEMVHRLPKDL